MNSYTSSALFEKTLIQAVKNNNLLNVKTLLENDTNNKGDTLCPAVLMATIMGYSDIVEELVSVKNNNTGQKRGRLIKSNASNRNDILTALYIAKTNETKAPQDKSEASQDKRKMWNNIIRNLSWALIYLRR